MSGKADRSILKLVDQTRDEDVENAPVKKKINKKRVSFNESIAIKTIAARVNINVENRDIFPTENDENVNVVLPKVAGLTPSQSKKIRTFNQQWTLNEEIRRMSLMSTPEPDASSSFFEPLQPKLTSNRHLSFYVDPDDEDTVQDEQAFHHAEVSMLNATVQPNYIPVVHSDDFSRFLSEEGLDDMDISAAMEAEPAPEPISLIDLNPPDLSKEDLEPSILSTVPITCQTYVVSQEKSNLSMNTLDQSASKAGPHTYTIMKDQSIDVVREANFNLSGTMDSWNQPSQLTASILDFTQENSRNMSMSMSMIKQPMPVLPVPCEDFSSPLRQGRRRTFVVVHRSEDREQRRERMLRERASLEPVAIHSQPVPQPTPQPAPEPQPSILSQSVAEEEEYTTSSQASQPLVKPQNNYKYTLPQPCNLIDPHELVRFFFENSKLDIASFNEALTSLDSNDNRVESVAPPWTKPPNYDPTATPQRTQVLTSLNSSFFKWTPSSGEQTLLSPSNFSAPGSPDVNVFEEKVNKLKTFIENVQGGFERLKASSRLTPKTSGDKPELLSRMGKDVTHRLLPETGAALWQFPCQPGTARAQVLVSSEVNGSVEATVRLVKSEFGGPWLSKLGDIALAMIGSYLGVDSENNVSKHRFKSQSDVDSFLVTIDKAVGSTRHLVAELIRCAARQQLYDPDKNFTIKPNDTTGNPTQQVLSAELSAFPVLAILPGGLEINAMASIEVDIDLSSYPSPGSLVLQDATFFEGNSTEGENICAIFDQKVRELLVEPSLSITMLSQLLATLSQVA